MLVMLVSRTWVQGERQPAGSEESSRRPTPALLIRNQRDRSALLCALSRGR